MRLKAHDVVKICGVICTDPEVINRHTAVFRPSFVVFVKKLLQEHLTHVC